MTEREESMKTIALRDPDQSPGKMIVIYDGHCRICAGQMRTLARLDLSARLTFLSLHDPRVRDRCPDLTFDQLMARMYVIAPDGARHAGSEAVRRICARLPILWPLGFLLALPGIRRLWDRMYPWIAKQRYRFGQTECEEGTCALPRRQSN
jgi:predicted DCC family thiol-disulfide oxidoreductase YuxK